ncbi:MAG: hypothetical protein WCH46_06790 [bacterium]
MKLSLQKAFYLLATSVVLLTSTPLLAKWDTVFVCHFGGLSSGPRRAVTCGFFFNEFQGIIASTGDAGIFKTRDGGKTWKRANTPATYVGDYTSIFMKDTLNGWATIEEPAFNHGGVAQQCIFQTIDGGLNWSAIGPKNDYACIYQTTGTLVATSRNKTKSGTISPDNAASFQQGMLVATNGVTFVDDLNGVATGFENTSWKRTVDGGRNWIPIVPQIAIESWGVYGVKNTPIFYAAPETDHNNQSSGGFSSVYRSSDYGATWSAGIPLTFYTTGHISGFKDAHLYIQFEDDNANQALNFGMFRSDDQGNNWIPVGGPKHINDKRFVVTGCNGGVVYAFEKNGNVLKTRDGGDGGVYEPPVEPLIYGNPVVFQGPICSTSAATLEIENLFCGDDSILSAIVLDSNSALISSGALKISTQPTFPLFLASGAKDSIRFTWEPLKLFHTDTTVYVRVKVTYYSKVLGASFDTILTLSLHAIGDTPNAAVSPSQINLGDLSYCNPADTSFWIKNIGCDTLYLTATSTTGSLPYQLLDASGLPIKLPIIIKSGDSTRIFMRVSLAGTGTYSSTLKISLRHQGIYRDTSVAISAVGVSAQAKFTLNPPRDTLFDISMTRCDSPKTFKLVISNPGCENIKVLSATLVGDSAPNISLLNSTQLPADVNSTSTTTRSFSVTLEASAKQLGMYSGSLKITYQLPNRPARDTVVHYFLRVNYGSRILSASVDTIDLGSMKLCDTRDSFIIIKNIGCDTMQIISEVISGNGNFTLTSNPLPYLIENAFDKIKFHFEPVGAGLIKGALTVSTVSDSLPIRKVFIVVHVIPTDTIAFDMLPTRSTFYAGDTLTVRLIPRDSIFGRGLLRLGFDINYNGDLVTLLDPPTGGKSDYGILIQAPSFGTPKHTTTRIDLIGNPTLELPKGQSAAEFRFYVRLSDSITTEFALSNIELNGNDKIYQRCNLGIFSNSLVYQIGYHCGDSLLVRLMQLGDSLHIFATAIYPNPLTELNNYRSQLNVKTSKSGNYEVRVYDGIGQQVYTHSIQTDTPGTYSLLINGKDFASGLYSYILFDSGHPVATARGRFVVAK